MPRPNRPPEPAPATVRTIDIVITPNSITQNGEVLAELPVQIGETIVFRITNEGGIEHDLYIGPRLSMIRGNVDGLPGVPGFLAGTEEFTWVVPADIEDHRFGCVVAGHYISMNGRFVPAGDAVPEAVATAEPTA